MYKYENDTVKTKLSSPVTLTQAKDQFSVEHDFHDDDRYILSKINQATAYIEDRTGIDISSTKNKKEFFGFEGKVLNIFESPLNTSKNVKLVCDDVELEEGVDFDIETKKSQFNIRFKYPVKSDKIVIEFNTGYEEDQIPFPLESAILIKANDLYDMERTSYVIGANFRKIDPIESLIAGYTVFRW